MCEGLTLLDWSLGIHVDIIKFKVVSVVYVWGLSRFH